MITKIFLSKEFAMRRYCHYTHRDKKIGMGGGMSNWDILFWVGTGKWDKVGHGMVGGSKWAWKNGTSFMDVP